MSVRLPLCNLRQPDLAYFRLLIKRYKRCVKFVCSAVEDLTVDLDISSLEEAVGYGNIIGVVCLVIDYLDIIRGNYDVFVILGVCRCCSRLIAVDVIIGMVAEPVHSEEVHAFALVKVCEGEIINYNVREVAIVSEIPVGISVIDKVRSAVAVMSGAILNCNRTFPG